MSSIIEILKLKPFFDSTHGVSSEEVKNAESTLALKFSKEYTEYLLNLGQVTFEGHELTGLCEDSRLNVVNRTIEERKSSPKIPQNLYVVEDPGIDGIIVWQSADGCIYMTPPYDEPVKIYESLTEYVGHETGEEESTKKPESFVKDIEDTEEKDDPKDKTEKVSFWNKTIDLLRNFIKVN